MTSEGPHRPGQEPDEVSPGAGGPAPYGDRMAQQEHGFGSAAPDLGWAPPPPANRPQPPAPAWNPQAEQPPTPTWGAASVHQQGGPAQPPAWGDQGDAGQPAWAVPGGQPQQHQQQPGGWRSPEEQPPAPAWGNNPGEAPQAAWAAAPAPRQPHPQQPGGWNAAPGDPQQSGGWNIPSDPQQSGGWNASAGSPQGNPWEQQGEQPQQAGSWAATAVPQQGQVQRAGDWDNQGAAAPADGWGARAEQPQGTWGAAAVPQQNDPAPGGWNPPAEHQQPGPWNPAGEQQDNRWGAAPGPSAGGEQDRGRQDPDEPSRNDSWNPAGDARQDPQQPGGWGAAAVPQQGGQPEAGAWAPSEPAAARASASVPGGEGGPAWAAAPAGPPQWNPADNPLPPRPVVPEAEPWSPAEAWGTAGKDPAGSDGNGWEGSRDGNSPIYQPAPAPGISPANAVPLPPQEQRVPGASLAAAPPADYVPPAQFAPPADQPAYADAAGQHGAARVGYEAEQPGGEPGWGGEARPAAPQSPAGPAVPHQRTSPEDPAGARASVPGAETGHPAPGAVSASASVPMASRVTPPTDQALHADALPAPQPRVYGRPARPADDPEPAEEHGHQPEHPGHHQDRGGYPQDRDGHQQHHDGHQSGRDGYPQDRDGHQPERAGEPRFDGPGQPHERPGAWAEAPGVTSAPPAPAGPPEFPVGVPSFTDPPAAGRQVNGVKPHSGGDRPAEHFGAAAPVSGGGADGAPGYGPTGDQGPGPGGYPPAFPPGNGFPGSGPSQGRLPWEQDDGDQSRFDAFKAEPGPKTEAPTPKIRNGRVLLAVLTAAVLILVVPLGLLLLLGKAGGDDKPASFDPAVGSCVKQSGTGAVAANCGEQGAFTVVSKVDAKEKCADPAQPHLVLPGDGASRVLCLKPATAG